LKHNKHCGATDPPGPVPVRRKRRNGRNRLLAGAAVAAALLAAILLAGCGGGSNNGGVAHVNSPASASSPPSSSGSAGASEDSRTELMNDALKYSACMRSHGLSSFPDPTEGSNGLPSWTINAGGSSGLNTGSSQYQAAQHACKNDLPDLGAQTPAAKAAASAKALKYVACMKSHGEPGFPDPNGQGVIEINNATGILNPNSPQYAKAQTACQKLDSGFEMQGSAKSTSP
jgi:hypothetical protein